MLKMSQSFTAGETKTPHSTLRQKPTPQTEHASNYVCRMLQGFNSSRQQQRC